MKKLLLILVLVLLLSVSKVSVNADNSYNYTPFSDYYSNNARFQYISYSYGGVRGFNMTFEQDSDTGSQTYLITLKFFDSDGKIVYSLPFFIDPEEYLSSGVYMDTIYYDWSNRVIMDMIENNEPVFYKVVYNNSIDLWSGGVMLNPEFENYDSSEVEFGDYVYNVSGLVDGEDQSQFTYNLEYDDYVIIHYRFPDTVIAQGFNYYVNFFDLNTMTSEFNISSTNILDNQGGSEVSFRNSFIPVFLNEDWLDLLDTSLDSYDIHNLYHNFDSGSYLVSMLDNTTTFITDSEASAILNLSNFDKVFDIKITNKEIELNRNQKATFIVNDSKISSVYESTIARDQSLMIDWIDLVDESAVRVINYSLSDSLFLGDIVSVVWQVEPISLPYSLDTEDYRITEINDYVIVDSNDIDQSLTTILDWSGLNNTKGLLFISVIILLSINIFISIFSVRIMVTLIINAVFIGLLAFLGFIPSWFLIGVLVIFVLGILFKINSGGGE